MQTEKIFLEAEWRKLIMANYAVDPTLLKPLLPAKTELDLWNNTCYVSLVGFMFVNTQIKGIRIPFHIHFEEVNLRFYVRHFKDGEWRRGVVFIKEIVPKPAISIVANLIYKEHYVTHRMRHTWKESPQEWNISYGWKKSGKWNEMAICTNKDAILIGENTEEEFITEHYWGYTRKSSQQTAEYGVEHPRWKAYKTKDYSIVIDFAGTYGTQWGFLKSEKPVSVFMAEGSEIIVRSGRAI
jgi:uncharacterized protein